MWHIFSKKKFLADYLENFVDVHNHILPGIDDGAETIDDSLDLIKGFGELGVKNFVPTPHIMHNYYPNTPETIRKAQERLKNAMLEKGMMDVVIDAAAEHMIDDNFEAVMDQDQYMPLAKDYILVEMSFLQPPINFEQAIIKITGKRLYPILAHPERYKFLHNRTHRYARYRERGIFLQMNLLSLGDYYGKGVQSVALKLLERKQVDFVASDIHNMHQLNCLKEIKVSNRTLDRLLPVIERTILSFY